MNKHVTRATGTNASGRVAKSSALPSLRRGNDNIVRANFASKAPRVSTRSLLAEVNYVRESPVNEVDEKTMIASSTFPIKSDKLIELTREFLAANNGCDNPELLSDDFTFAGPVVGPIPKNEFIKAFSSFSITEAFPDMQANFYNFHVDPFEHDRVWFSSRATGTHTGVMAGKFQPTGKKFISPPQMSSCKFNKEGQVTHLTAGYVLDRAEGNTGGLGGVFGILYAIGKPLPFPEAMPWKKSWQYKFFGFLGPFLQKLSSLFKRE